MNFLNKNTDNSPNDDTIKVLIGSFIILVIIAVIAINISNNPSTDNIADFTVNSKIPDSAPQTINMDQIKHEYARQTEQQFYMAEREGDLTQTYVQAQLVASAYLQANDEYNYRKWKAIQRKYARKIGL